MKVATFEEEQKRVTLVWSWVALPRSDQGYFEFFKWNRLVFTAHYYCSYYY